MPNPQPSFGTTNTVLPLVQQGKGWKGWGGEWGEQLISGKTPKPQQIVSLHPEQAGTSDFQTDTCQTPGVSLPSLWCLTKKQSGIKSCDILMSWFPGDSTVKEVRGKKIQTQQICQIVRF